MKNVLYLLLLLWCLASCKTSQVVTPAIEVQAPDSLPDPVSANGWKFVRTSINGGLYVPPVAPKKMKIKGSYNTKAKKDAIIGENISKVEAPKKIQESIIGDGNTQIKPEAQSKTDWIKWVCAVVIVVILGYVFGPFVRNLLSNFSKK